MPLESSIAYLRGEYVPFNQANLSIASSSVLYGLSVYTVCNIIWDGTNLIAFRLKDHYKRLCNSARIMGFAPFESKISYDDFEKMIGDLLQKNKVEENTLVRIAYFIDANAAGCKIKGLNTAISAYILKMNPFYLKDSIDVCISSWIRLADNMIPPRAKVNGSYANQCLMKNEALQKGFDEAIAINSAGHVSEATVANIFYIKNSEIFTPDTDSDILEGITRDTVMKIKKVTEKKVSKEDLYTADEIFLTGNSANIVSIGSIDGKRIPNNKITKEISEKYNEIRLGKTEEFREWLTFI